MSEELFVIRDRDNALMFDTRSGKLRTYKSEVRAHKYAEQFCWEGGYSIHKERVRRE